jgi:ketosteroid isomerase-like protein
MDLELAWLRSWLEVVDSGGFAKATEPFYEGMGDDFPGLEVTVVRDITSGEEAALEWAAVLIDRAGNRFPIYGVNLVRIRDGKFTHVRAYYDPTKFPQPAGR